MRTPAALRLFTNEHLVFVDGEPTAMTHEELAQYEPEPELWGDSVLKQARLGAELARRRPLAGGKPSIRFPCPNCSGLDPQWITIDFDQLQRMARRIGYSLVPGTAEEVVTRFGGVHFVLPDGLCVYSVTDLVDAEGLNVTLLHESSRLWGAS